MLEYYFSSAAVAVDSSRMATSSSASWSRFSQPSSVVNGHVSTMWFMVCRWPQSQEGDWARLPALVQVSTTWILTCPETVRKRQYMTREIETWLSHSRIGNNGVVDHRSRRPVLSPLRNIVSRDVMSNHIGRRDTSRGGGCPKTSAHTGQFE